MTYTNRNMVMVFDKVSEIQPFVDANGIKYLKTGTCTALRQSDNVVSVFYPDEVVRTIRSAPFPSSPLINIHSRAPVIVLTDNTKWSSAAEALKYYQPLTPVKVGK